MRIAIIILNVAFAIGALITGWLKWDPTGRSDNLFEIGVFIAFLVTFAPFVSTYSKLGLNPPKDRAVPKEITDRQKRLRDAVPDWRFVTPVSLLMLLGLWLTIGGIFAIISVASLVSAYWFARVHRVAMSMFRN